MRFVGRNTKLDNIAAAPAFTCIVPNRPPATNTKSKFSTSIYILVMAVVPSLLAVPEVSKSLITNPLMIRPLSQFCTLSILSTHSLFLAFSLMLSDIFLLSLPKLNKLHQNSVHIFFDVLLTVHLSIQHLSQYLTNLVHKICFTICFISCLYMFRAHVLIFRRSKLHYTASGIITPIEPSGSSILVFYYALQDMWAVHISHHPVDVGYKKEYEGRAEACCSV